MKYRRSLLASFFLFFLPISSYANFSTGIGYIEREIYREDNELNPLPLGLSTVPFIAYRGENLSVYGPNVEYRLLKGIIGASLHLQTVGDRFEAHEVKKRDTGVNAGVSLRLLFLSLRHTADIFHTYNGNVSTIDIGHREKFGKFIVMGQIGYEYLNQGFSNYYYGVREDEVGHFQAFELKETRNEFLRLSTIYQLGEGRALNMSYGFKRLDPVIFESPTVNKKSFKTWSIFYSVNI